MTSMQLVFLFDLNAFNSVQLKSTRELNENLQSLRLTCLRLLTYFSNEVRTLRWGFKFFDSCGSLTQAMDKFTYQNFSLENFEILENEICLRYQRHASYLEALAESVQRNTTLASNMLSSNQNELQKPYPIKLLQLALTQILCEYHWESFDVTSPVRSTNEQIERKNYLFFVTKCTETVEDFKCYFGVKHVPVKNSRIHSLLLSPSLHKQLLGRAGIQWVWLSTSKNNFLSTSKSEVLSKMSDALQSLQCSLIPLSVLSQPVRRPTIKEKNNLTMDPADESTNSLYVHYAFIPFSTVFRQSLCYPFYSINDHMINKSVLCSPQNGKEIPVSIINFSLQSKRDEKRSSEKYNNTASEACNTAAWSKFVIRYAVKRNIHSTAYDLLLCLPLVSATSSTDFNFRDLIKALIIEDKSLVVDCETVTPGLMIPGLFSPLSDDAAVISIIDPVVSFFEHKKIDFPKSIHHKQVNEVELKAEIEKEMKCLLDSKEVTPSVEVKKDGFLIKPFEAECLETWFAPNQSLSNLTNEISTDQITSKCKIQAFHKMLQQTLRNRKLNEKKSTPKISPDSAISCEQSDVLSEEMSIKDGSPEDYTDLNSADLKAMLENIYSSALEPSGSVLQAAKKIVKNVSHFFQKENSSSYEDNVKQFVKDNFFSTVLKIHQKYDTCENEESANKRIKEYQMQALLALELEALFKSSDETSCVKIVTSFLRAMSFYSGASELNKLLFELLKENYSHNLYNILVNIGDELDIPIVGDAESPDSMDDIASLTSIPDPELSSGLSLTFSEASSTSTSYRKLIRRRSDISDTKSSRQILLPGTSPKKKKVKSSAIQKKAVRCSPRLAVKKKKDKSKCVQDKSQTVRRNLFPKETQPQTPKKSRYSSNLSRSKKLPTTPKGKHSLKASFVAETPSHKQNFSALQRRKASMEVKSSQREVAESPQISKIPKDSAKLALLKKLKVTSPSTNKNIIATKNSELALGNFILRSPETKRRLSLKLFSKLLSSPTARMGIKKCSKRLFDDVSPHSSGMPNKKPKLFYECNK